MKVSEMGVYLYSGVVLSTPEICAFVQYIQKQSGNTGWDPKKHTENWFVEVRAPKSNSQKSAAKQRWIYEITSDWGSHFVRMIVHKCTIWHSFPSICTFDGNSCGLLQDSNLFQRGFIIMWAPLSLTNVKCSLFRKNINHHSTHSVDNSPGRAWEQQPPFLPVPLLGLQAAKVPLYSQQQQFRHHLTDLLRV